MDGLWLETPGTPTTILHSLSQFADLISGMPHVELAPHPVESKWWPVNMKLVELLQLHCSVAVREDVHSEVEPSGVAARALDAQLQHL